ncbi:MAG: 4Fe-4S dicluster domain-containing protein, partial [Azonexus sp.]|nr:4Fe-4S dicluster domain-containing protein [Azonexus sp.]
MVDASRRGFFRGRPRPKAEIRPPWAIAEALFVATCTRCNDCLKGCPEQIIVVGDGGYPRVDFKRGECTFCGDCAGVCQPLALTRNDEQQPAWFHKAVIGSACLP